MSKQTKTHSENGSSSRVRALRDDSATRTEADEGIRWDKVLDARRRWLNGSLDTPEVWRETLRRFAQET